MAAHRYPYKMNERERQMKARRSRFVSCGYRSAGRMVTFGLLQSLHGFSLLGFLKSVVVAALTIAAVCLFFAYLPVLLCVVALIAAVVLAVVLVQRHKQQGPAVKDPGSQNAPRAAKGEVRLFAACPSCGARYQFAFRRGCTETVCRCNACGKSFKVESSGAVWPLS